MFLWLSGRVLRQQRKRLWVQFPGNTHTDKKCIAWIALYWNASKSLRIKASAKCKCTSFKIHSIYRCQCVTAVDVCVKVQWDTIFWQAVTWYPHFSSAVIHLVTLSHSYLQGFSNVKCMTRFYAISLFLFPFLLPLCVLKPVVVMLFSHVCLAYHNLKHMMNQFMLSKVAFKKADLNVTGYRRNWNKLI